jgi:hypothetical protein
MGRQKIQQKHGRTSNVIKDETAIIQGSVYIGLDLLSRVVPPPATISMETNMTKVH